MIMWAFTVLNKIAIKFLLEWHAIVVSAYNKSGNYRFVRYWWLTVGQKVEFWGKFLQI